MCNVRNSSKSEPLTIAGGTTVVGCYSVCRHLQLPRRRVGLLKGNPIVHWDDVIGWLPGTNNINFFLINVAGK